MLNEMLCGCLQCLRDRNEGYWIGKMFLPAESGRMILCEKCGNKRCPHATDHRNACTGSNESGQPGSAYGVMLPKCTGNNCGCTDGRSHSDECYVEHEATVAHNVKLRGAPQARPSDRRERT